METRRKIIYLALALFTGKVSIPAFVYLYRFGMQRANVPEAHKSDLYEMHNLVIAFVLSSIAIIIIIEFLKGSDDKDLDKLKNWPNRRNEP